MIEAARPNFRFSIMYTMSWNTPERRLRIIKEEISCLHKWEAVQELPIEMKNIVEYFNENYLNSTLGYKTPNAIKNQWLKSKQITHSQSAWSIDIRSLV